MRERFSFKEKNYYYDENGDIYEESLFGGKVGKMEDDGNFTIKSGLFSQDTGRISSWTNDVYETSWGGLIRRDVGDKKHCFLSSSCISAQGLDDNCLELTTLRDFRREYLVGNERGETILEEYHRVSSQILHWIENQDNPQVWYDDLYYRLVKKTIKFIDNDDVEGAIIYYQQIVREYLKLTSD